MTGAVAAVGVLSAALTGWWTAEHFYRWFASRWLAAAGTLLVTLNPVSLRWYLEGHSDGLFAALALGCVVYFAAYASSGSSRLLVAAALLAAAAASVRYVGLTLAVFGCFSILALSSASVRARLRDAVVFSLIAAFPLALIILRNVLAGGMATGVRFPQKTSVGEHLYVLWEEVSRWMLNAVHRGLVQYLSVEARFAVTRVVFVAGLVVIAWICRRCRPAEIRALLLGPLLAILYLAAMTYVSSNYIVDQLSGRFLLPAILLMLVFGMHATDVLGRRVESRPMAWLALMGAVSLVAAGLVWPSVATAGGWRTIPFNRTASPDVAASKLVSALRVVASQGPIYAADTGSRDFALIHLERCVTVPQTLPPEGAVLIVDDDALNAGHYKADDFGSIRLLAR